jgi:hypothetical protein
MSRPKIINRTHLIQLIKEAGFKVTPQVADYFGDYLTKFVEEFLTVYDAEVKRLDEDLITDGWNMWFPADEEGEGGADPDDDLKEIILENYFPEHICRLINAFKVIRPDTVDYFIKLGPSLDSFISEEAKILAKSL